MQMAVGNLTYYLCETSIEEEIVDFTEMGGWHKVDKLLPLVYDQSDEMLESWVSDIREAADNLKASGLSFF
jgi:hypothetical protein